jgi:hypothetical protein
VRACVWGWVGGVDVFWGLCAVWGSGTLCCGDRRTQRGARDGERPRCHVAAMDGGPVQANAPAAVTRVCARTPVPRAVGGADSHAEGEQPEGAWGRGLVGRGAGRSSSHTRSQGCVNPDAWVNVQCQ